MPPSTGVLESFNRPDEAPITTGSPASTGFGKPNLTGEHLEYPSSSYRDWCHPTSFPANQEVYYTVSATTTNRFLEAFARVQNPNTANLNAYNVEINTNTGGWTLSTVLKNAYKSIGTGTKAIAAGDKVWLKCEGTSIKAIHVASGGAETTIISVTDSAVTGSGQIGCGMQSSGANLTIDDFGGGALSTGKTVSVGQVTETSTALGVSHLKSRAIAQAFETDTAQVVSSRKTKAMGQSSEVGSARATTPHKARSVGLVSDNEEARPVAPAKTASVGQASEVVSAGTAVPSKSLDVGKAGESGEALSFSPVGQHVVPLGRAAGVDEAQSLSIGVLRVRQVGQAVETEGATSVLVLKRLTLDQALEASEAGALASLKAPIIAPVVGSDSALALDAAAPTATYGGTPVATFSGSAAATYGGMAGATYRGGS